MKPEDLVVGKLYEYKNKTYKYVTRQREFLTRGIVSIYVFKNPTGEHEFFDDEYLAFVKEIEEKPTPHPNIYTGEKTMPEERTVVTVPIKDVIHCNRHEEYNPELAMKAIGGRETARRKPEQIRIELTNEETIQALSSLGYDLTDYEFDEYYSFPTFVLRLKKEADEKTKTTD